MSAGGSTKFGHAGRAETVVIDRDLEDLAFAGDVVACQRDAAIARVSIALPHNDALTLAAARQPTVTKVTNTTHPFLFRKRRRQ